MKVAIYARYSSELQSSASIDDQIRICRDRAAAQGWTVSAIYKDAALSGASDHRPEYQRMMKDAVAKKFDIILAESVDRLSRDQEHLAHLYKLMRHIQVPIHTLTEGHINAIHIGIGGLMSAVFLEGLAQKTHRGLEGRVQAGKSAGGKAYGYKLVRGFTVTGEPITGELRIDEDEAKIVIRILEEYAAGESPRAIAADLNRDKIAAPGKRGWPHCAKPPFD